MNVLDGAIFDSVQVSSSYEEYYPRSWGFQQLGGPRKRCIPLHGHLSRIFLLSTLFLKLSGTLFLSIITFCNVPTSSSNDLLSARNFRQNITSRMLLGWLVICDPRYSLSKSCYSPSNSDVKALTICAYPASCCRSNSNSFNTCGSTTTTKKPTDKPAALSSSRHSVLNLVTLANCILWNNQAWRSWK